MLFMHKRLGLSIVISVMISLPLNAMLARRAAQKFTGVVANQALRKFPAKQTCLLSTMQKQPNIGFNALANRTYNSQNHDTRLGYLFGGLIGVAGLSYFGKKKVAFAEEMQDDKQTGPEVGVLKLLDMLMKKLQGVKNQSSDSSKIRDVQSNRPTGEYLFEPIVGIDRNSDGTRRKLIIDPANVDYEDSKLVIERVVLIYPSPDSTKIFIILRDGRAGLWDRQNQRMLKDFENVSWCSKWSLDSTKMFVHFEDNKIEIWDLQRNRLQQSFENTFLIDQIPDSTKIFIWFKDDKRVLWDVQSNKELKSFENVVWFDWSKDRTKVKIGFKDHTAVIWDVENNRELQSFENGSLLEGGINIRISFKDGTKVIWYVRGKA